MRHPATTWSDDRSGRTLPCVQISEPLGVAGDPWIDAYMRFRRAWRDGATEHELTDLARELKRGLPSAVPPVPAALFIHRDILITSRQSALPAPLVRALGRRRITLSGAGEPASFEVTIPAGITDGQRIRLAGEGGQGYIRHPARRRSSVRPPKRASHASDPVTRRERR